MPSRDPDATFHDLAADATLGFTDDEAPAGEGRLEERARRYDVRDELGRGGIGRVLRAWDRGLDREVALKTLIRTSAASRARFARETRITARLQHPNIVPVYEGGTDADDMPFFAMRLVHGGSLTQAIRDAPDLSARLRLLPHVIDACNAVAYAHSHGITHRDLKPDNILVGGFGETLVIDWGLAKDLHTVDDITEEGSPGATSGSSGSLTRVGSVVGTPAYMPPEQAVGRPVDLRADVYALGAVLYHALAGVRPYAGEADPLAAVVAGPPTPLGRLAPGAPPDLVAVVEKAMSRVPADRYADARALAAELEAFEAGRLVSAHHYTLPERVRGLVRRNPLSSALAGMMVVGGLLSVAALGQAWWVAAQRRDQAEEARADAEALRDEEQRRRDAITLDQARLLVDTDPGGAITLLAGLSDAHVFDGTVRTVAAAAFAAQPGARLDAPGPTSNLQGVGWVGQVPVAIWDGEISRYTKGHRPEPTGVKASALLHTPRALYACGPEALTVMTPDGEWRLPPFQGTCALTGTSTGLPVLGSATGEFAFFDLAGQERARVSLPMATERIEGTADGAFAIDLNHQLGSLVHKVDGSSRTLRIPVSAYGAAADPEQARLVILGANPAATLVDWRRDDVVSTPLPVDAPWLEFGAWVGTRVAMIGGGPLLYVHDPDAFHTRRVDLPAAARSITPLDEAHVLVGLVDGRVVQVDLDRGDLVPFVGLDDPARFIALSPDGTELLVGGRQRAVRHVLERRDGRPIGTVDSRVYRLATVGDDLWIAAGAGVFRWRGGGLERVDERAGRHLTPCGGKLWVAGLDDDVFVPGTELRVPFRGVVEHAECSPDGTWLVAANGDGEVVTLDPVDGAVLQRLRACDAPGAAPIRFGPGGSALVACDRAWLLDDPRGDLRELGALPTDSHESAWWGDLPVVSVLGGAVLLDGAPFDHTLELASLLQPLPDGGLLVGDAQGGLRLWRDRSGPPESLEGHLHYVQVAAVRPDGRFVATGGWDDTIWLWDLSTQPPSGRPLRGHSDAITGLVWSADGRVLTSADRSGVLREWFDPLPLAPDALRAQIDAFARAVAEGRRTAPSLSGF